jgi:hypothetical protein
MKLFLYPVNGPASAEIDQNNGGLCAGKGISKLCRSESLRVRWLAEGKVLQPVVLVDCRAKAMCGKKQASIDLIFWLLFYQEKSNKAQRQLSGLHIN